MLYTGHAGKQVRFPLATAITLTLAGLVCVYVCVFAHCVCVGGGGGGGEEGAIMFILNISNTQFENNIQLKLQFRCFNNYRKSVSACLNLSLLILLAIWATILTLLHYIG